MQFISLLILGLVFSDCVIFYGDKYNATNCTETFTILTTLITINLTQTVQVSTTYTVHFLRYESLKTWQFDSHAADIKQYSQQSTEW